MPYSPNSLKTRLFKSIPSLRKSLKWAKKSEDCKIHTSTFHKANPQLIFNKEPVTVYWMFLLQLDSFKDETTQSLKINIFYSFNLFYSSRCMLYTKPLKNHFLKNFLTLRLYMNCEVSLILCDNLFYLFDVINEHFLDALF